VFIQAVKSEISIIRAEHDPKIAELRKPYQAALDTRKALLTDLERAEKVAKEKVAAYDEERIRKQEELVRKMQEEARRKAQEEMANHAADLFDQGKDDEAEELLSSIDDVDSSTPLPVFDNRPKVEGMSTSRLKRFRVIDKSKISPQFLIPDEKAIQQVVNALGDRAEEVVGGIKVYIKVSVSSRG